MQVRVTIAVAQVLQPFLADVSQPRYGYELMQLTGFPSGKLYPILARLAQEGWLVKEREDIDTAKEGRPARTMYRLSEHGAERARHELAVLREQFGALQSQPIPRPRLRPDRGLA